MLYEVITAFIHAAQYIRGKADHLKYNSNEAFFSVYIGCSQGDSFAVLCCSEYYKLSGEGFFRNSRCVYIHPVGVGGNVITSYSIHYTKLYDGIQ